MGRCAALVLSLLIAICWSEPQAPNNGNNEMAQGFHLTAANFDDLVGKDKHVLVKFYAPCKLRALMI
jgi:hypothetical protein